MRPYTLPHKKTKAGTASTKVDTLIPAYQMHISYFFEIVWRNRPTGGKIVRVFRMCIRQPAYSPD
ncbi:MAG: hypothetical protein C4518_08540 [Desulfobacteraceae bacterium]|nr:MAG: hypothetical protein C4518_08540 [Desulfobacteraceae bacterium]